MSSVALNSLLDYLQATLDMDNRRWLAEHLIESADDLRPYTREELIARIEESEADIAAGRFYTDEEVQAEVDALLNEWKQAEAA